jgi:hypothetical protein
MLMQCVALAWVLWATQVSIRPRGSIVLTEVLFEHPEKKHEVTHFFLSLTHSLSQMCPYLIPRGLSLSHRNDTKLPVAARSKAWVCGRSLAEIAGSNLVRSMDVSLLWVPRVGREKTLQRADPSSRGVLPRVCLSLSVIKSTNNPVYLQWVGRRGNTKKERKTERQKERKKERKTERQKERKKDRKKDRKKEHQIQQTIHFDPYLIGIWIESMKVPATLQVIRKFSASLLE